MKKIIYLLSLFPAITLAQETVNKKSTENGVSEEYYVLKSHKKIKHGSYQKIGAGDYPLVQGYYKNNIKDSAWVEYWMPLIIKSKGNYVNNQREGIWEFYNRLGILEQKYDFTKKELVYDHSIEKYKEKLYKVVEGRDTIETKLQTPPLYIGGSTRLQSAVGKGFRVPVLAGVPEGGPVRVSFIVDNYGKTSSHKILATTGTNFDKAALIMAKQIPDNWLPGVLNGEPVNVEYILTIDFKNMSGN
jgi:hypothetical protein